MQAFFNLFTRYLSERASSHDLYLSFPSFLLSILTIYSSDWDRIKSPADDQIVPYANLSVPKDASNLNKLAVLKVNGGLGTSMGISSSFF